MPYVQPVAKGATSSTNDLDQIVQALNGVSTTTPVLVSNRIQAGAVGATSQSGVVGGTVTAGDPHQDFSQHQPDTTYKPGSPVSGSFLVGDIATDATGLLWMAVANTSGTTPWYTIGKGGDYARTRATVFQGSIGGGFGPTQSFSNWDWGGVQYKAYGALGNQGFLIPTTGYYQLTSTIKCGYQSVNTSGYAQTWIQGTTSPNVPNIISIGDIVTQDGGPNLNAGSMTEDIFLLTAGMFVSPYVQFYGPSVRGTVLGSGDSQTADVTIYASVELLMASTST